MSKHHTKRLLSRVKLPVMGLVAAACIVASGTSCTSKSENEKAQTQLSTGLSIMQQAQQMEGQTLQIQAMPDSTLTDMMQSQGMLSDVPEDSVAIVVKEFRAESLAQLNALYNQALQGDGTPAFPGFIKIAQGGKGDASNMACYLAGICYYRMGNYKEAIKWLSEFDPQGDRAVSPMALAALANSYVGDGQVDKAIEIFKEAAQLADNASLTPMLLIEAAKLLEHQKQNDAARQIYEQVRQQYPYYAATQQGAMVSEVDAYIERTK